MFKYKIIKLYLEILKGYWVKIILFGLILICSSFLLFPIPFLIRQVIDTIIPNKDIWKLIQHISLVILLIILSHIFMYSSSIFFLKINTNMIFKLKQFLLQKIFMAYRKETEKSNIGFFLSRIEEDTKRLNNLFIDRFVLLFSDFFKFSFGVIAIFILSKHLALITFLCLPIFIVLTIFYGKKMAVESKKLFSISSENSDTIIKLLENIVFFKVYMAYSYVNRLFFEVSEPFKKQIIKTSKLSYLSNMFIGILLSIMPVLAIGLGGYLVICNHISLGTIIAYNSIAMNVFNPIQRFINFCLNFKTAKVSITRLEEIMLLDEEPILLEKSVKKIIDFEEIVFRNILFEHEDKVILNDMTLSIKKGEKIGIYGKSGAGKSTIIKILTGIYLPQSGEVVIDGVRLTQIEDMIALRSLMSCVEQEPVLLKDSIRNNINLGNNKIEFEYYSIISGIHQEIVDKNRGYESTIGKDIVDLSLGQKQRIAIIRAICRQKPILILDEITSSLDIKNEKNIISILSNLDPKVTIISISHKFSSFEGYDKVFELSDGKLVLKEVET